MQIFEALSWRSQTNRSSLTHFWASNGAFLANVTQPIVVGLLCLALFKNTSTKAKLIAVAVMLGYIIWLIYKSNKISPVGELTPNPDCSHLNLSWWDKMSFEIGDATVHGAVPYFICLYSVLFLLLRPTNLMLFSMCYITVAFLISACMYTCGTGSVWCWLAAFAPLFTWLYCKYAEPNGVI